MELTLNYKVRAISDLKDMLDQSFRLFGEKNAFLVKSINEIKGITYHQFKSAVDALGTAFIHLGLKDTMIAVIGENRYEWCVSYLATVNGTGVVVPLDKDLPPSEVENLLQASEAKAIVFSGKHSGIIEKISSSLRSVKYFIDMDAQEDNNNILSFHRLVEKGKQLLLSGDKSFIDAKINPTAMNMLLFTSGTTSHAKGVMLSHKNICSNITAVMSTVHVDSNDASLSILPIHHTYECTLGILAMLYSGGTIAFNEGLRHIAKNFKEFKPTILFAVPLLLENMYKKIWEQAEKQKGLKTKLKLAMRVSDTLFNTLRIDLRRKLFKQIHETFGGRLRLILTGAAAIDPDVSKGLRTFGIKVLQGYGLTECSPLVIGNTDTAFKDASIGLPLPGVSVRLEDVDENGIGELVVKGDNVMLGYYKNEEATRKVLKDGWFYTGDLGYADKSGFYYISGRKKNVIVTKNGKNIYPEEVEAYLNKSPFILESLVWGQLDEKSGETFVNAQIVPDFESIRQYLGSEQLTDDECLRLIDSEVRNVNKNMPLYKRIYDFSIRETEFVKTTTKKIKRYIEEKIK
ncbi:MAG: AMP-binding protein [Clostridia bacterium]|nr:AMP-binding protein [Clostridia bacterium]